MNSTAGKQLSLAIIIPALNEESTIGAVVHMAGQYGLPIVIDDGSKDRTAAIARESGAEIVVHMENQGYDNALNSGFDHAAKIGCKFAVTMDADGQHNPELVKQFIEEFNKGADVIIGVRDRRQRVAEHIFAFVTKLLWQVKDPLCGMKGYRMTIFNHLNHFDSCGSIGTELALFAVRNNYRLSQIPVLTRDRIGASRFGDAIKPNVKILRALFVVLWRTLHQKK